MNERGVSLMNATFAGSHRSRMEGCTPAPTVAMAMAVLQTRGSAARLKTAMSLDSGNDGKIETVLLCQGGSLH